MTVANDQLRALYKKPHKYGAKACMADGHRFPSHKERDRYLELRTLAMVGEIKDLKLQPRFALRIGLVTIATYVGDFSYYERDPKLDGARLHHVVEDTKGHRTRDFILKAKLFQALYPDIELRIL
jgi:hypothetical protein